MFKQWCSEQGFTKGSDISHVLMDGGTLYVPFDRLNDFYKAYIQCIKGGEQLFVVEQKSKHYNFFLDIDYKHSESLDIDQIRMISLDICAKVETLGLPSRCLICVAKPKKKNNFIKTGIHLNWPDLTVCQEGAIYLMYHIISTLNITHPNDNWNHYIDKSVYGDLETGSRGSGFRMPWSHKKAKHTECGGKGCTVCEHTGKLTEGEYLPIYIYSDGIKDCSPQPTEELLWMATIRTQQDPVDVPVATFPRYKKKEGTFTSSQTKNEIKNEDLKIELETFIRRNITGQSKARIRKMFKNKTSYFIESTSKFCSNLEREHNSNHVWFLISQDGTIVQKCFCRCETMEGRKYGFCKDYASRPHKLSYKICSILYPNGLKTRKQFYSNV